MVETKREEIVAHIARWCKSYHKPMLDADFNRYDLLSATADAWQKRIDNRRNRDRGLRADIENSIITWLEVEEKRLLVDGDVTKDILLDLVAKAWDRYESEYVEEKKREAREGVVEEISRWCVHYDQRLKQGKIGRAELHELVDKAWDKYENGEVYDMSRSYPGVTNHVHEDYEDDEDYQEVCECCEEPYDECVCQDD